MTAFCANHKILNLISLLLTQHEQVKLNVTSLRCRQYLTELEKKRAQKERQNMITNPNSLKVIDSNIFLTLCKVRYSAKKYYMVFMVHDTCFYCCVCEINLARWYIRPYISKNIHRKSINLWDRMKNDLNVGFAKILNNLCLSKT